MTNTGLYQQIYAVVGRVPYGRVATYGQIARIAGFPGQARLVGYALHQLTDNNSVPWHRIINGKGKISLTKKSSDLGKIQKELLKAEGIHFKENGSIDIERFLWIE